MFGYVVASVTEFPAQMTYSFFRTFENRIAA